MRDLSLAIREITDTYVRDNFQKLKDALLGEAVIKASFSLLEIDVPAATTNFRFPHRLGYTPKDILVTSAIGSGTVTWNYDKFDSTNLDLTTTGAVKIRAFVGAAS